MKLSIQIVNFKSRHFLQNCLFSIGENMPEGLQAELILINNDEEKLGGIKNIASDDLPVRVVEVGKNIGFGKAHNLGAGIARGEFILFLNPDTKILGGAIEKMLAALESDEKTGIAGPFLVDQENNLQADCFGREKTPLSTIKEKMFSKKNSGKLTDRDVFETDWVSGGALMARKSIFLKAGKFDEKYFMYFEDVDLCREVKRAGCKVVIAPGAKILHEGGKSFESEKEKKKSYYASQDYYLKKHFGPAAAVFVKIFRIPYYAKNVWLGR